MVAERSSTKNPARRSKMAAQHPGDDRQPTLADEIKELEQAEKVTAALQARVDTHSITRSPTGAEPQEPQSVTQTPRRSPIVGKTPSPV